MAAAALQRSIGLAAPRLATSNNAATRTAYISLTAAVLDHVSSSFIAAFDAAVAVLPTFSLFTGLMMS